MVVRLQSLPMFAVFVVSSISLAGQDPAPRELFLPILVNGVVDDSSHFQTVFRFVETSGTTITPAVSVALEMFDNDGGLTFAEQASCPPPVPVLDPIRRFDLAGWASLHFGTKGFMQPYEPDVGVNDGWARIRWSGPGNLSVVAEILAIGQLPGGCPPVICFRPSTAYRSDALIEPQLPALEFHSPAVISRYRHAAFSIVNPAPSATANVYLELYDQSGALVRRGGTTALPPCIGQVDLPGSGLRCSPGPSQVMPTLSQPRSSSMARPESSRTHRSSWEVFKSFFRRAGSSRFRSRRRARRQRPWAVSGRNCTGHSNSVGRFVIHDQAHGGPQ